MAAQELTVCVGCEGLIATDVPMVRAASLVPLFLLKKKNTENAAYIGLRRDH